MAALPHSRSFPQAAMILAIMAFPSSSRAVVSFPSYSVDGIVNAATQTVEALGPNTIATIYGTDLAFTTRAVSASDVAGASLPRSLDGVLIYVGGLPASLFFISPGQINFLIPYELAPGMVSIIVTRQGLAGPTARVQLNDTSPGFFQWSGNLAIAVHLNGSLVSPSAPAQRNEIIVLYAGGLGWTSPDTSSGRMASLAATILAKSKLQVLLDGTACPAASILYAGLAPGFAGLYQINLRLPDSLPHNPDIRMVIGAQSSPTGVVLPTQ